MTNEEIEKRFLFDLEMGIFKDYPILKTHCYKFSYSDTIVHLIHKLGFRSLTFGSEVEPDFLVINLKTKTYFYVYYPTESNIKYCNEIPDYLKEYKLE